MLYHEEDNDFENSAMTYNSLFGDSETFKKVRKCIDDENEYYSLQIFNKLIQNRDNQAYNIFKDYVFYPREYLEYENLKDIYGLLIFSEFEMYNIKNLDDINSFFKRKKININNDIYFELFIKFIYRYLEYNNKDLLNFLKGITNFIYKDSSINIKNKIVQIIKYHLIHTNDIKLVNIDERAMFPTTCNDILNNTQMEITNLLESNDYLLFIPFVKNSNNSVIDINNVICVSKETIDKYDRAFYGYYEPKPNINYYGDDFFIKINELLINGKITRLTEYLRIFYLLESNVYPELITNHGKDKVFNVITYDIAICPYMSCVKSFLIPSKLINKSFKESKINIDELFSNLSIHSLKQKGDREEERGDIKKIKSSSERKKLKIKYDDDDDDDKSSKSSKSSKRKGSSDDDSDDSDDDNYRRKRK